MNWDWLLFFEKAIWLGFAAIGFGILFNVPYRSLLTIWILGALGGLTKYLMMHFGLSVVISSFFGATLIGVLSVYAAHNKHAPPMVFAIASVIPMVPGAFAYRMMIGMIKLAGDKIGDNYNLIMAETMNNGLKATFIFMALAAGVAFPMLLTRKESAKNIRLRRAKR
jgi:uncharacterized membrane protein YjjB (DUF3815 family)